MYRIQSGGRKLRVYVGVPEKVDGLWRDSARIATNRGKVWKVVKSARIYFERIDARFQCALTLLVYRSTSRSDPSLQESLILLFNAQELFDRISARVQRHWVYVEVLPDHHQVSGTFLRGYGNM